jgi:glucosamine--fructose-6-phosphate aminotransferase (isomerizing)
MCGIVGYLGKSDAVGVLLDGLKRLEYRGYDSAGVAVIDNELGMQVVRSQGKIAALEKKLEDLPVRGMVGIAHTRWATHGRPSDDNAHPHRSGPFVVVHNGIIENYADIKAQLEREGFDFSSETDTEVIVKLAERQLLSGMTHREAVVSALRQLRGSYAVVFLNQDRPGELLAARKESPLILALGENEFYLASDVPAILPYTRRVIYLEDGDLVTLNGEGFSIQDMDGAPCSRTEHYVDWNPIMAEKAGFKHFMLKEIHEQPHAIIDTFRTAVEFNSRQFTLPDLRLSEEDVKKISKVFLVACGTSYHACLVGKYMIENLCRIPVEVDLASEFRYRHPLLDERTLMLVISQSGETADTKAALQEAAARGAQCRAIVNVVGSSLARMASGVIYTHAGPEIGVASTKAFTAQLIALYVFALYCAQSLGRLDRDAAEEYIQELVELPGKIEQVLSSSEEVVKAWARRYMHAQDFLYLARGILYPVALEGALKLKEISYIHAEGYAAGEMKHGPIALIDENMPVVVLMQSGGIYEKMLSNVQEVRARGGQILALVEDVDEKLGDASWQLVLSKTSEWLAPVLFTVPLQLLAYHIAVLRGTDVDQPRNLAKSVTVE